VEDCEMRVWVQVLSVYALLAGVCLLSIGNSFETQAYAQELQQRANKDHEAAVLRGVGISGIVLGTLGLLVATPWLNALVFRGCSRSPDAKHAEHIYVLGSQEGAPGNCEES
jgi:hypothetical protein